MKTVRLEELNQHSFKEAKIDKLILPVGSCESHGEHLPYGCDSFVCHQIGIDLAERLENTVVAPPQFFGMSQHYRHKPMCLSLSSDTVIRVVRELLDSAKFWGINKVLIVNGHDGNIAPIEIAARDFKVANPDFGLAVLDAWWVTAGNLLPKDTFEVWDGLGHGGEGETSIGLSIFPDLCDMSRAKGEIPEMDNNVKLIWNFEELTQFGASGDPTKATAAKGDAMRSVLVDYLVDFVNRMDEQSWKYVVPR
ncbi:creatininase family protein [Desulfovibrio sp. Fe33]|uniref:creatininase family protein n=1 Tax=Desulfovibrio sp. Fe33 TaxID=3020842 RepID=UPI00234C6EBA|nr:creatininase family protein [Desulfovibrio sp. Fe33]